MKQRSNAFVRFLRQILVRVLSILILLWIIPLLWHFLPSMLDLTGRAVNASVVLERRLSASSRLETTQIDVKGQRTVAVNALLLGTVGSVEINYDYHASVGIDLSRVTVETDGASLVLCLPPEEILSDSITATATNVKRFWIPYWSEQDTMKVLQDEQHVRRQQEELHLQSDPETASNTEKAFLETVGHWEEAAGFRLIIRRQGD